MEEPTPHRPRFPRPERHPATRPEPNGNPAKPPNTLEGKLTDDDIRTFNATFATYDPAGRYRDGTLCYYCGGRDNSDHNIHYDHTIPRCLILPRNDAVYVGYRGRRRGRADPNCPPDARVICVRSCKRCNLLLANRYFASIRERVEWVRNTIRTNPATLPTDPIWKG